MGHNPDADLNPNYKQNFKKPWSWPQWVGQNEKNSDVVEPSLYRLALGIVV